MCRVIFVEGKTDKEQLQEILNESIEIACTNGTLGSEKLEEWIIKYADYDVYVLADADEPGEKM
ncbi:MAG: hypothetical protein M0T74_09000, partial [Desulfitobacterium hafniense]|nr:hypothetical protein [Desulfitobacterium hafniense]